MQTQPAPALIGHLQYTAAGRWDIDVDHTNVEFRVRHGLTKMRGRLNAFSGTVDIGADPAQTSVEVRIDAASIDTGTPDRDTHLRSPDFFDVETHPFWTYRSTKVSEVGDDALVLEGDLTVRGVTRPVSLDLDYHGLLEADPWGMTRASFTAAGTINREDFGVSWNDLIDAKIPFIGKSVRIELEVELIYRGE